MTVSVDLAQIFLFRKDWSWRCFGAGILFRHYITDLDRNQPAESLVAIAAEHRQLADQTRAVVRNLVVERLAGARLGAQGLGQVSQEELHPERIHHLVVGCRKLEAQKLEDHHNRPVTEGGELVGLVEGLSIGVVAGTVAAADVVVVGGGGGAVAVVGDGVAVVTVVGGLGPY